MIASLATPASNTGDAAGDTYINIQNLLGGKGNDTLTGDDNNNIISGGGTTGTAITDRDVLNGLGGDDTFMASSGQETFNGGDGTADTVVYSTGVVVNMETPGSSTGDASGDVFGADIEAVTGSGVTDTFFGRGTSETIDGAGGNDFIFGSGGADTLIGGIGIDTLDYSSSVAVNVNLSDLLAESGGDATGDKLSGFEIIIGSANNDILTADNTGMTLRGGLGNDTLTGGTGNDILQGGSGRDTLIGGAGEDRLDFVTGNSKLVDINMDGDSADGGAGNDVIAISYDIWAAGNKGAGGFSADGGAGTADVLELQMASAGSLSHSSLTASQFNNLEVLDLSKDAVKTTLSLSAAGVQGLVDAGNSSVLTLRLGTGAGDVFQIAGGEFATQSANTVIFYSDATLTTQTAQINLQYV